MRGNFLCTGEEFLSAALIKSIADRLNRILSHLLSHRFRFTGLHRITKRNRMKRYIFAVILIVKLALLTGCNTMSGLGQDIEQAGDALEKAATKHKSY